MIRSSTIMNSLYENEKEYNEEVEYDTYIDEQYAINVFAYNNRHPNCGITVESIRPYITYFENNKMEQKPELEAYFNRKLSFPLIVDFMKQLETAKVDTIKNTHLFFVKLSHFYNLMSFLDVDSTFIEYIKHMLIIYLHTIEQMNRETIEKVFKHVIWELDQCFKYEIITQVYFKVDSEISSSKLIKSNYERIYSDVLKDYDPNKDYSVGTEYLDKYLMVNTSCGYVVRRPERIILEGERPFQIPVTCIHVIGCDDEDEPEEFIDGEHWLYYEEYDKTHDPHYYYYIVKYNITEDDSHYESYVREFIYKSYQCAVQTIARFNTFIKELNVSIQNIENVVMFEPKEDDDDSYCYQSELSRIIKNKWWIVRHGRDY